MRRSSLVKTLSAKLTVSEHSWVLFELCRHKLLLRLYNEHVWIRSTKPGKLSSLSSGTRVNGTHAGLEQSVCHRRGYWDWGLHLRYLPLGHECSQDTKEHSAHMNQSSVISLFAFVPSISCSLLQLDVNIWRIEILYALDDNLHFPRWLTAYNDLSNAQNIKKLGDYCIQWFEQCTKDQEVSFKLAQ